MVLGDELSETLDRHKWLSKKVEQHPKNIALKLAYAWSLEHQQKYKEEYLTLKRAYSLDPENLYTNRALSSFLAVHKNPKEAIPYWISIVNKEPFDIHTLYSISQAHQYHYGDEAFRQLTFAAAHIVEFSEDEKTLLYYALGKAYDDTGDLKTAFSYYALGTKLHSSRNRAKIDYEALSNLFKKIKK